MSRPKEQELRERLRLELLKSRQFQPNSKQDAAFQELLDSELKVSKDTPRTKHLWFAAAMAVLALGFIAVVGRGLLPQNKAELSVVELIDASNQIESELSSLDKSQLNSMQYIEVLKIRDDIGELDSALNSLYQRESASVNKQIQQLWEKRLQMARQLKAIYNNEYMVARI